jgi:hypothetical protein
MPDLNGTIWRGKNFKGEECVLDFAKKGGEAGTFTYSTKAETIKGSGWFFRGYAEMNDRSHQITSKFALEFITNYARFRGDIIDGKKIIFDEVIPRVVKINYAALFGKDYKGRKSIIELFDCAGQDIGAFAVFDIDQDYARKNLEHTITFELQDERMRMHPGPKGLGDASFYKWVDWKDTFPELIFIRWNFFCAFPSNYVYCPDTKVRKEIERKIFVLDEAIKNENPAVTIIHMPKVLEKMSNE